MNHEETTKPGLLNSNQFQNLRPLGIPKNTSFHLTRSVKKQPSLMERRRLSSFISLSVSAKSQISDPREDLKSGDFKLDKSHLAGCQPDDGSTAETSDVDESAIDKFLAE